MNDLIERLEKATGPDRELDRLIQCVDLGEPAHGPVPEFTKSVDDALTLVGYQREWVVGSVTLLGTFYAEIITPTERHTAKGAPTAAIALCIAAFKARMAHESQ